MLHVAHLEASCQTLLTLLTSLQEEVDACSNMELYGDESAFL